MKPTAKKKRLAMSGPRRILQERSHFEKTPRDYCQLSTIGDDEVIDLELKNDSKDDDIGTSTPVLGPSSPNQYSFNRPASLNASASIDSAASAASGTSAASESITVTDTQDTDEKKYDIEPNNNNNNVNNNINNNNNNNNNEIDVNGISEAPPPVVRSSVTSPAGSAGSSANVFIDNAIGGDSITSVTSSTTSVMSSSTLSGQTSQTSQSQIVSSPSAGGASELIKYSSNGSSASAVSTSVNIKNKSTTIRSNKKKRTHWRVLLWGPDKSPYEGGVFKLLCEFGKGYPVRPPTIMFETKIFHMNVNNKGKICLKELIDEWNSEIRMIDLFENIYEMLSEPDPAGAINKNALTLYCEDIDTYEKTAQAWTRKFADINTEKETETEKQIQDENEHEAQD